MVEQRNRRLALLGGWLASVVFLWVRALPTWNTVVDDAYITARYAEHAAAGYGLVYNAGEPPIEGFTNLAFALSLTAGRLLGLPMHQLMIGLGFGFAVLALAGVIALCDELLQRPAVPWLSVVPALMLASTPHFAIISTNGLETSQFVAWVVWALWAARRAEGGWRWAVALLVGLGGAVRPEGLFVSLGIVLIDLIERRKLLLSPTTWAWLTGTLVCMVPVVIWRVVTYGAWVPNTAAAKGFIGFDKLMRAHWRFLAPSADFWIPALVILLLAVVFTRWSWAKTLILCQALGLSVVALRIELWMPGGRLLVAPLALALVLAVVPLQRVRLRSARGVAWTLLLIGFVGYATIGRPTSWERNRDRHHSLVENNPARLATEHIVAHLPDGEWLVTRDAGLVAWAATPRVRVAETHPRALTQPHPNGKDLVWGDVVPKDPAVLVFTVNQKDRELFHYRHPEQKIWRARTVPYVYLGRAKQHYRRHYDFYVRADLDVPPLPPGVAVNFEHALPGVTVVRAP